MSNRVRQSVLIAGVIFSISAACLAWGGVRGSGKFIDEKRPAGAFHAVEVSSGIKLVLAVGAAAVEVHAEDNIAPLVLTDVHSGVLIIRYAEHTSISDDGVTVKVSAPSLDAVEASGGSTAEGELGPGDSLKVEASGGGELHLRGIDAKSLTIEGSGGATLDLKGKADQVELDASGGTRFPLGDLAARTVRIDASGGAEGHVHASETVRGEVSGGTELRVSGGARTRVSSSGGSSVDVD